MDENLLETNSIYNNNAKSTTITTNNILNTNINKNNTKLIEFIHDLKEAIQNGEFQSSSSNNNNLNNQQYLHQQQEQQLQQQQQQYETINHVNNLSNQTFSYIINWLKQQQFQIDEAKDNNNTITTTTTTTPINQDTNSSDLKLDNSISSSHVSIEIRMLKNQLRTKDDEKEKLFSKFKQLQDENIDLKTKLFNLKTSVSSTSASISVSNHQMMSNQSHKCDKDFEIDKLKHIIENLLKANDDKDKRIDDLTKQVQRFKRIQDLVFTAQSTNTNTNNKTKVDFDLNDQTSETNSLPLVNHDQQQISFNQKNILINSATKSASIMEATNKQITTNHQQQQQNHQKNVNKINSSLVIASNVNQACNLISSCSLSSSLSSTSSTSSASSSASTSPSLLAQSNVNNLTAPLATISELINYSVSTNSPNNDNKQTNLTSKIDHYNTLPNSKRLNNLNDIVIDQRTQTLGKLNSKSCVSSTASSNTIINEEDNGTNLNDFNSTQNWIQKETLKLNKNNKKGSFSSLNESNDTDTLKSKQNNKNSSPSHTANKGLRNFFGKLIRTSLVNINESNFISQQEVKQSIDDSAKKTTISNDQQQQLNKNLFRRGGVRATANARLQNSFSISNNSLLINSSANDKLASSFFSFNLDTLAFSKFNSTQCYDWLCRNGFDCYFNKNSDGTYQNKWLKNGLHLLKASKYEYEKELGIKSPLHRKKLSILLQSMYDKNNINLTDINLLSGIDYHWVTKWLDDIGLPQYKDVFNETKIDGLMLNILSIDDLISLNINSELHYLSIKRGIHVLQINNFDIHCLRRRPSGDDQLDKSEVALWTNHRVMEWLRSIDLSEYAPNLRGSGVHGALMVYEARFNSTVLADLLAIPTSKTLLRRHLNTLFCDLIGPQVNQIKLDAEANSSYQPLSASNKLKQSKRLINVSGIFSHKRTKSQDSRDFFNGSISLLSSNDDDFSTKTKMLMKNYKALTEGKKLNSIQSATLPNSVVTFCESNGSSQNTKKKESKTNKLSIMPQESVPTSIV